MSEVADVHLDAISNVVKFAKPIGPIEHHVLFLAYRVAEIKAAMLLFGHWSKAHLRALGWQTPSSDLNYEKRSCFAEWQESRRMCRFA